MGRTERFWNWLATSTVSVHKKGHPDLYPLDVTKLAKELRLPEEGRRLGEAGLPSPDAKALSGPEAATVQRVEKARQDYVDWAVLRLSVLSHDLSRRQVTQAVNRARQADKEFERKASGLLSDKEGLLRNLGETAKKRKAELDAFQTKHGLTREANYPNGAGLFFRYAILLVLIVVEGGLNAAFFAQGLSTGLVGGFMQAAILAAVNVLVAFVFGKSAVCYINHTHWGWKLLGMLSLLLAAVLMTGMGLAIAHYRDSLTSEASDAARNALQMLLANPFELRDTFSWTLFIISVGFGVGSLIDGLYSNDLYPGFGDISKRTQVAVDDHEVEMTDLRLDLESLKDDELKTLDEAIQKSQAAVAVFKSLIEDKKSANSRLSNALRDADNSLDALLSKFRTENEMHRNGAARPRYFDSRPELRALVSPDFDTRADETSLAEQDGLVKALLAEAQQIRASIQESFNQQFDRLKPLDTHFPRNGTA